MTPEEQQIYDEQRKRKWDNEAVKEQQRLDFEAVQEQQRLNFEDEIERSRIEERKLMALAMKKKGFEKSVIAELSHLTVEEIEKL